MARTGDKPTDFRSESERVRPRAHGETFRDTPKRSTSRAKKVPPQPEAIPEGYGAPAPKNSSAIARDSLSDTQLTNEIVKHLSMDPETRTSDITVEVSDGVVILTGSTDTINTKYRIEELTRQASLSLEVENYLSIRTGDPLDEHSRGWNASRAREDLVRRPKTR